jgi:uncharacterized membrane protein
MAAKNKKDSGGWGEQLLPEQEKTNKLLRGLRVASTRLLRRTYIFVGLIILLYIDSM